MGDRESRVMAEKRHLEAVGTVAYSKLSRLEADPSHVHAASFCRSGVLPGHASDGHYSYQGTYFSYPLQYHESPELSVHWNPSEPYVTCTDGAVSQQLRPEKARCMLYRQESGGLGTWAQDPSYEKRKDCLGGDTPVAQEKWAHYSGHTDFIQQGWIQGFPMLHSARVPTGCPPLVAPKPVYRNHGYCTDARCSPKGSLASGMQAESPSKRPTNVEWTLPTSGHPVNASCGSSTAKKAPVAESGFLPLHQSWKDAVAAPAGFSPYHKIFENLHVAPSASLVDTSYPAGCKNPKSVPDECSRSPCGKAWSKLPLPDSPLSAPQGLLYQERSSACYPLSSYPLTSHEQLGLYQRSLVQAEKQKALFALPACKSFNFPAGEDTPLLPRTCFPPAPQSYYPSHLDSYSYRALGSPVVTAPNLKASRELESPQNSQPKTSFEQRDPISTCSVTEKASCGSAVPSRVGARDHPGAEGTVKPAQDGFRCQRTTPQPCAFQTLYFDEGSANCADSYQRRQEESDGAGSCPLEKGHSREKGALYAKKQPGLSSEDKKRDADKTFQSGACIVIPDSPVASHDSCLKGDSLRSRISESLDSAILQSPDKVPRDLKTIEAPPPPSSPPMPVIHNVFSLAPYRDYLEGTTVSLHLPTPEGCPVEKLSHDESRQKAEGTAYPRPPSAGSSKMPGVSLDKGRDMAYNTVADCSRKGPRGSCIVMEKERRGDAGFCENYRGCPSAPATSWQGATDCASEFAKDEHVLDLSLKTEGLPNVLRAQRPPGKVEVLEWENSKRHGESAKVGPAKGQDTNLPELQPPQQNCSEKSNFQSSAAFLYKKFKIPKSQAAGPGSTRQQNLFQSSSQIEALSNNFPLQQDSEQVATQQNCLPVQQSCHQVATQQNSLPVQQSCRQAATRQNNLPVQKSCQQAATRQNHLSVQQSCQQAATRQNHLPVQQSCQQAATRQNHLPVQSCQQAVTRQNSLPLQQSCQQVVTRQNSLPLQQNCQLAATRQNSLPLQQSCQQAATQQNHLSVPQSSQLVVIQQNSLPLQQICQQAATRQNHLHSQQSCQKEVTRQNSLPVHQSSQVVTRQNSLPVQQSFQQMVTRRNSLPALHVAHEKSAKPNTQRISRKCLKQPDVSKPLPPAAPAGSPALGEVSALHPTSCESPAQQVKLKKYFTAVHASVCAVISDSVSTSSPELLNEWLEKTVPEREPKPKASGSAKAKSGPKTPEALEPSKGKRVWLTFKDAAGLFNQLLLRLETILFTRKCPFPHVVRAGTIFIPIHVVKEQLFSNLPGVSVDHVLQAHKVELRPTTLSEEKLLRELDLKTCTSRMLKLLALKQLPDIYPDLLDLHWRHCIKQQLGEAAEEIQSGDIEVSGVEGLETAKVSRCLQSTTRALGPGVREKHKQGRKCERAPQGEAPGSPPNRPIDTPKSQGPPSSSFSKRNATSAPTKGVSQEDPASLVVGTKRFRLRPGAKRQLFRPCRLSGALPLKLAERVTRSTSKVLRLRKSTVHIKFRNALQERQGCPVLTGKKQKRPASVLLRSFRRQRLRTRHIPQHRGYPELVGKRIRHLYEEKDKTEAWYRGVVLRVHEPHKDPLKTVYEVKYDSEPEWQYYLEILQDYKKGWLEVDE